jgi:hypothetical protein
MDGRVLHRRARIQVRGAEQIQPAAEVSTVGRPNGACLRGTAALPSRFWWFTPTPG